MFWTDLPSADAVKGEGGQTGGIRVTRLAPKLPHSLPGVHPQNRIQIEVILQAAGGHHPRRGAVVPQKRTSGIDSVRDRNVSTKGDKATRRLALTFTPEALLLLEFPILINCDEQY